MSADLLQTYEQTPFHENVLLVHWLVVCYAFIEYAFRPRCIISTGRRIL